MNMVPVKDASSSFDELIFKRELNEVYLLLDFISGRPDVHIGSIDLKIPKPDAPNETLSAFETIEYICKLRYPPDPHGALRAADATLLLLVKDKLSSLAYPARGMTIAYTYSFIEPTGSLVFADKIETGGPQTRISVAKEAYPGLYRSARRYRKVHRATTYLGVFCTVLAAISLWYVAYGVQITTRFEEGRKSVLATTAQIYTALDKEGAGKGVAARDSIFATCNADNVKKEGSEINQLCNEWSYVQARYVKTIADACMFATNAPSRWLIKAFPSELGYEKLGCGRKPAPAVKEEPKGAAKTADVPDSADAPDIYAAQEDIQSITLVLSTYATYVLPILFGLVGTIASMLRGVGDKIAASVLSPRDEALAFLRIPLGLMAGVAVGLFFSPTTVATQVSSGSGVLTLTASGIAFLAGYGAEGFFRMVDGMIARVFSLDRNDRPGPVK